MDYYVVKSKNHFNSFHSEPDFSKTLDPFQDALPDI